MKSRLANLAPLEPPKRLTPARIGAITLTPTTHNSCKQRRARNNSQFPARLHTR